ncbi:MAG: hypothetical protein V3U92_16220 [Cellulophaga sp.]
MKSFNKTESYFSLIIILWGLFVFYLGYNEIFLNYHPLLFGFTVVTIMILIITTYWAAKSFRKFSDTIPLRTIALLHSWRIFAGWAFLASTEVLPETFVRNAGIGDIIAGFLGLGIFIFGSTKRNHLIFNIIGLADFLLAVGTGITLTLLGSQGMSGIMKLPLIIIPLLGVPLSGYSHVVALKRLFGKKGIKINEFID